MSDIFQIFIQVFLSVFWASCNISLISAGDPMSDPPREQFPRSRGNAFREIGFSGAPTSYVEVSTRHEKSKRSKRDNLRPTFQ